MQFYKGGKDVLENLTNDSSRYDAISSELAKLLDVKNLSFLFGAGCSSLKDAEGDEPGIKSTISENEEKWVYSFTRGKVTSGLFTTKSDITTKILDLYLKEDIVINFAYSQRDEEI